MMENLAYLLTYVWYVLFPSMVFCALRVEYTIFPPRDLIHEFVFVFRVQNSGMRRHALYVRTKTVDFPGSTRASLL